MGWFRIYIWALNLYVLLAASLAHFDHDTSLFTVFQFFHEHLEYLTTKQKPQSWIRNWDQLNLEWILLDSAVILTFKLSTTSLGDACITKIHAKLEFVSWIYKRLIMRMDVEFLNYMQILIWYLFCWVLLVIFFFFFYRECLGQLAYSHLN